MPRQGPGGRTPAAARRSRPPRPVPPAPGPLAMSRWLARSHTLSLEPTPTSLRPVRMGSHVVAESIGAVEGANKLVHSWPTFTVQVKSRRENLVYRTDYERNGSE